MESILLSNETITLSSSEKEYSQSERRKLTLKLCKTPPKKKPLLLQFVSPSSSGEKENAPSKAQRTPNPRKRKSPASLMSKKAKIRRGNSLQSQNNVTINLEDSTQDSNEIINSTLLSDDNRFNFIRTPRLQVRKKKCPCECNTDEVKKNSATSSPIPISIVSSHPEQELLKNKESQDSCDHELTGLDLLVPSKRRNIEQWLNKQVHIPTTPFPFTSGGRTSVNKDIPSDESLEDAVKEVLDVVYGPSWRNTDTKNKTDVKINKRPLITGSCVARNPSHFTPSSAKKEIRERARRNIFNVPTSTDGGKFNSSFGSGIRELDQNNSFGTLSSPVLTHKRVIKKRQRLIESSPESSPRKKNENSVSTGCLTPRKTIPPPQSTTKTPRRTFLASLSVSSPKSVSHPEAQDYKINFKSKKDELLKRLFTLYNKEVFQMKLAEDMKMTWNPKMRGTAGYCYNRRITKSTGEVLRSSRIELATKIIDRADRLRDTLLHEMCHAAAWVIDGVLDGHGPKWQNWTNLARERFPELPAIRRCHSYDIVGKFTYKCTKCGYSIQRHSRSIDLDRKRCGHCFGQLELLLNKFKKGETEVPEFNTTRTMRTPNKFAIFVKDNYNIVKDQKGLKNHGEVMKAIGEQYRIYKNAMGSANSSKKKNN